MTGITYKIVIVIPARYGSTRFEGKPLAEINEKPMIYHVYQRCKKVKCVSDVIVATDDERIKKTVEKFGGKAAMTSKKHKTGTERVAEAVKKIDADIIVNVQGDEPLIDPRVVEKGIKPLIEDSNIKMSTLMTRITDQEQYEDPNVVKVVTDKKGFALYFSRSIIPFIREKTHFKAFKHLGIYIYQKDFLLEFANMPQTPLEQTESLEQLRALENGFKIKVIETDYDSIAVDVPEDLEKVRKIMKG